MVKGTLTIPQGGNSGTITVIINADNIVDDNEYLDILLNRPVNATLSDESGRVTILNTTAPRVGTHLNEMPVTVLPGFEVKVLPNPSWNYFSLLIRSESHEPVSIKVMDALGRIVERKDKIQANDIAKLGSLYRQGLYYAEVIQGNKRVVLKFLKCLNDSK